MTTDSEPRVYDDLAVRFRTIFHEDFRRADAVQCARDLVTMIEAEGPRSTTARAFLHESGLRDAWNNAFDYDRSRLLAARLAPYVIGNRVVDVLAGTGTLTRSLAECTDAVVSAWEVEGAYQAPFVYPVGSMDDLADGAAADGTVVISTVLHHELDYRSLLARCARLRARRWLVVENCVHDHVSKQTHEYVDEFFNGCLNDFDVPCSYEHKSVREWIDVLEDYGRLAYYSDLGRVPGMPFPYELFVIDIPAGT